MKFTLFFIPLLLATVSGLPLEKLIKDPASLIASLSNSDPDSIAKLKAYVAELVKDGEAEEAAFTATRDAAQVVFDGETLDLTAAEDALAAAKTSHAAASSVEAAKSADENAKGAIREAKLTILTEKTAVLNEAIKTNKEEQARLDREKALFQEIKGLLVGVKADVEVGRHLLSDDEMDPTQVDQALKLLDDLIAAGEVERQGLVDAQTAAQAAHDVAKGIHATAVAIHTLAEGAQTDAQLVLATAKAVLNLRTSEHATAVDNKQAALEDLNYKQDILDTQSARIASEALDLDMINDLLDRLV